jgi:hypothetical protein
MGRGMRQDWRFVCHIFPPPTGLLSDEPTAKVCHTPAIKRRFRGSRWAIRVAASQWRPDWWPASYWQLRVVGCKCGHGVSSRSVGWEDDDIGAVSDGMARRANNVNPDFCELDGSINIYGIANLP